MRFQALALQSGRAPACECPAPAPFSSNPVLPHDTHPTMRRLARAARGTDPQVLGKALRAWPTQTRVLAARRAARRAARWAITAAQPQLLGVAIRAGVPRGPLAVPTPELAHLVVKRAMEWSGASAAPSSRPCPARLARAPALLDTLVAAGGPLEDPGLSADVEHPLSMACAANLVDLARALLAGGVDPDGMYRRADSKGRSITNRTPLALVSCVDMAILLLSAGARAGAHVPDAQFGSLPQLARNATLLEADLARVVAAWRAAGGQWDEPMENMVLPPTTLPAMAFGVAPPSYNDVSGVSSHPGTAYQGFQWALVANGFDLDTVAPDGRTYRDHLELRDTPAVRQWALEHTLPPARPQAGPGVRL